MDYILWITFILALLLSFSALFFVVLPLLTKQPPLLPVDDDRLANLLARKDSTLRAIKELEFDHQVGKISEEDYQRFNQRLSRQAIGLIQQLEKLTPESVALDEQLEAEIAHRRQTKAPAKVQEKGRDAAKTTPVGTPLPSSVMATPSAKRFCTECGARVDVNFKFCANCGAPVTVAEAVQG
ncbi:MAG: zinc ribbon domain-containing protein [Caldilineaceae bacterium]